MSVASVAQGTDDMNREFTIASQLQDYSINKLSIPKHIQSTLGNFITTLDSTTITLVEGDKPSIKRIHTVLHDLMVHAILNDFEVQLIDVANCFDPQYISTVAFEDGHNPHEILKKIKLARPFQMYQSASIVKALAKKMMGNPVNQKQLILMTCVSSQFFDEAMKSEDPAFPVPQLEMFRHTLGILQSIASKGYPIVLTEVIEGQIGPIHRPMPNDQKKSQRVHNNNLGHVAKIRIRIQDGTETRRYSLLNHPLLSPQVKSMRKEKEAIDIAQTSLNDFF